MKAFPVAAKRRNKERRRNPHGCRHDDGVRQLRLGELPRRSRMGRGDPAGRSCRQFRLRLPVVGRAPFQRLLLRARQSPPHDLPDGTSSRHRCRHGSRHPALARSVARGRERRRARHAEQGQASPRHGARPGAARIRRLPPQHGQIARPLRRGGADDRQGAQDRLHRGRRPILQAAAHRNPPTAAAFLRRAHLCRGVERGFGQFRRQARRPYGDVCRQALGDAAACDRAWPRSPPQIPWHRTAPHHADRVLRLRRQPRRDRGGGA